MGAFVEAAIRSRLAARTQRRGFGGSLTVSEKAEQESCAIAAAPSYREARMFVAAQAATLEATAWLTAAQVGQLAKWGPSEAGARLAEWSRAGKIFAIRVQSQELFPSYGFDPSDGFMPLKHLANVIKVLSPRKNSWGIAIWFSAVNGVLGGKRPQDLIAERPSAVIAAARDEAQGVLHG
ncbi:hypothetical protein ACQVBX_15840 [Dyella sp. KULCS107]|uniref:hypothetical protein n=1 Tax=Dyella sp. KULCS107 TaxID=3422216 RepID=UPI003D6E401A